MSYTQLISPKLGELHRIRRMKLFSTQRRHERYRILYTHKIIQGLVPNPGISLEEESRRGRRCKIPQRRGKVERVKSLKDQSFLVTGPYLFNCLPLSVRNIHDHDRFKFALDMYLENVPDCPRASGYSPPVCDSQGRNSNSLLAWTLEANKKWLRQPSDGQE